MYNEVFNDRVMPVPSSVMKVLDRLYEAGFEGYLVGGCVRDFLMGRHPKDYDVATNAAAEQTEKIFNDFRVIETGIKHGTVTVISDGTPVEVTTYRVDGTYSDGRHPDSVTFSTSIEEDLSRRDFTMNSVAYSPHDGWVDLFGGCEDIRQGTVKCVGEPDRRFGEDALRILRALRFASVLGFDIEPATADAIRRGRHLLHQIAVERITAEVFALMCGQNASEILREYSDVIGEILPPIKEMFGCEQDTPYHIYDVWEHTLHVIDNVPPVVEMRMAALLHDVGKPHCRTTDENGIGHFYGHADISADIAKEIFDKYLRTSNVISDRIITLVKNHDETFIPTDKIMRRRLTKYGEETLRQLMLLSRADVKGQAPNLIDERLRKIDEAENVLEDLLKNEGQLSLKSLAVNGGDLFSAGIPQSRKMGDILRALLNEVSDEKIPNEKAPLIKRALEMYKNS